MHARGHRSHTAIALAAPGELVAQGFFSLALSADARTMGLGLTAFSSTDHHVAVAVY